MTLETRYGLAFLDGLLWARFNVEVPEDNLMDGTYGDLNIPAGVYGPHCDDGCYLMLAPPSVGEHTIHFHVEIPWGEVQDVTYLLTITPDNK